MFVGTTEQHAGYSDAETLGRAAIRWESIIKNLIRKAGHLQDASVPNVIHVQIELLQVRSLHDVSDGFCPLRRQTARHANHDMSKTGRIRVSLCACSPS